MDICRCRILSPDPIGHVSCDVHAASRNARRGGRAKIYGRRAAAFPRFPWTFFFFFSLFNERRNVGGKRLVRKPDRPDALAWRYRAAIVSDRLSSGVKCHVERRNFQLTRPPTMDVYAWKRDERTTGGLTDVKGAERNIAERRISSRDRVASPEIRLDNRISRDPRSCVYV